MDRVSKDPGDRGIHMSGVVLLRCQNGSEAAGFPCVATLRKERLSEREIPRGLPARLRETKHRH
jgi:hypothetical protein